METSYSNTSFSEVCNSIFSIKPNFNVSRTDEDVKRELKLITRKIFGGRISFPSIVVAGTKGKGSTSTVCESILRNCGLKTLLFTSPHIISPLERIKIDGNNISETDFISLYNDVIRVLHEKELPQPFFPNLFTLMFAFLVLRFKNEKRNDVVAVIEVGIGGKFDWTKFFKPTVSVITRLDYDHTEILGDTPYSIAWNKFGIVTKDSVNFSLPQSSLFQESLNKLSFEKRRELVIVHPCWKKEMGLNGPTAEANTSLAVAASIELIKKAASMSPGLAVKLNIKNNKSDKFDKNIFNKNNMNENINKFNDGHLNDERNSHLNDERNSHLNDERNSHLNDERNSHLNDERNSHLNDERNSHLNDERNSHLNDERNSHLNDERNSHLNDERNSHLNDERNSHLNDERNSHLNDERNSHLNDERNSHLNDERNSHLNNERNSHLNDERNSHLNDERNSHLNDERNSHLNDERNSHLNNERNSHLNDERNSHLNNERNSHLNDERNSHLNDERNSHLNNERNSHLNNERNSHLNNERNSHLNNERNSHLNNERNSHLNDELVSDGNIFTIENVTDNFYYDKLCNFIDEGVRSARIDGRYQTIHHNGIKWCIDGAHTLESIKICQEWFDDECAKEEIKNQSDSILLCATSKNRDPNKTLEVMLKRDWKDVFYVTSFGKIELNNQKVVFFNNTKDAVQMIFKIKPKVVLATGSLYLVNDVLKILNNVQ
ncbi:hypothetical protein M9Y10_028597 [Tritrichomonas musculus]|uniref:tetrahydrofolate synthase n=1 Tax=Tritrichomonas musculus TaxID=1915356 RepID=A0ABR2KJT7_9EUKA